MLFRFRVFFRFPEERFSEEAQPEATAKTTCDIFDILCFKFAYVYIYVLSYFHIVSLFTWSYILVFVDSVFTYYSRFPNLIEAVGTATVL